MSQEEKKRKILQIRDRFLLITVGDSYIFKKTMDTYTIVDIGYPCSEDIVELINLNTGKTHEIIIDVCVYMYMKGEILKPEVL